MSEHVHSPSMATEHSVPLTLSSIIFAFVSFSTLRKGVRSFPAMQSQESRWKDFLYAFAITGPGLTPTTDILIKFDTYRVPWNHISEALEANGERLGGRWSLTQLRLAPDWMRELREHELEAMFSTAKNMGFFN